MPGLINDQVASAQGAMPPQGAPEPAMAPAPQQMQGEEMGQGESPDPDTDPNYAGALKFAMQALYENGAAEGVAESLRTSRSPVEGLANTAYEITSIVDERTEGAVPDELFALLATKILEEVADIGEAAGLKYKGSDIALALKQMILRYLGEQGMDTTQLQQAMDQVDPEEFNRMAEEGGEVVVEEMPA
jgi:hypothetical protein